MSSRTWAENFSSQPSLWYLHHQFCHRQIFSVGQSRAKKEFNDLILQNIFYWLCSPWWQGKEAEGCHLPWRRGWRSRRPCPCRDVEALHHVSAPPPGPSGRTTRPWRPPGRRGTASLAGAGPEPSEMFQFYFLNVVAFCPQMYRRWLKTLYVSWRTWIRH